LTINPKGCKVSEDREYVSVHLTLASSTLKELKVQARISFISENGLRPVGRILKHSFIPGEKYGFEFFYRLYSLFLGPYNFDENPFVLECEVTSSKA
jgi:hypothetical protein